MASGSDSVSADPCGLVQRCGWPGCAAVGGRRALLAGGWMILVVALAAVRGLAVGWVAGEAGPPPACPLGGGRGCAIDGERSPGADFPDVGGHQQQRGEQR